MTARSDIPQFCSSKFLGRGLRLAQDCASGDAAQIVGRGSVTADPVGGVIIFAQPSKLITFQLAAALFSDGVDDPIFEWRQPEDSVSSRATDHGLDRTPQNH